MENALTPQAPGAASAPAQRLSDPFGQARAMFAQPAIRRALPAILMVALVAAAALAWMLIATPPQRVLFASMPDSDKSAVADALSGAGIDHRFDGAGALTVAEDEYHRARMLLAGQGLPKAAPGGYAILDELPMGVSRAVEGERLRQARETELARSIAEIDSVAEARVHLAMPESSVFVRESAAPTASVIVRLEGGRSLSDAQVRSIVNLVASSVPGMKPDAVTIVDQLGGLLSKTGGDASGSDTRIELQARVEEKYRTQLAQLLTPLVGAGNFTAEVQTDINLDETSATRETYDQTGVVRAEQLNWTAATGAPATPGGIPGALSNTVPPPTTVGPPAPEPGADGTVPPAADGTVPPVAGVPGGVLPRGSEELARTYDRGKEVSVTRAAPGAVKRLSVAVLLREPEGGRPRSRAEIDQVTQLVRAAVGYDQARGDTVTVVSRKFSDTLAEAEGPAWYEAAWVPMVARNVTALVIALLVLLLGVRPLARALMKKRDEAGSRPALGRDGPLPIAGDGAGGQPVSIDMLGQARGYDDRVGLVRGFTRDNPARAALAVRDMIQSDQRS